LPYPFNIAEASTNTAQPCLTFHKFNSDIDHYIEIRGVVNKSNVSQPVPLRESLAEMAMRGDELPTLKLLHQCLNEFVMQWLDAHSAIQHYY